MSLLQSKGILSDRRIRRLCEKPTHRVDISALGGLIQQTYTISAPFTWEEKALMDSQDAMVSSELREYVSITKISPEDWKPMIEPYHPAQVRKVGLPENSQEIRELREVMDQPGCGGIAAQTLGNLTIEILAERKVISFGQSSYGYDLRVGRKFKIFTNVNNTIIDPKNMDPKAFVDFEGDVCIIPPNSFVLASSMEYLRMPNNVTGLVLAKSTYARTGQGCLATPLEAGWKGEVTLEYANNTPLPMKLYAGEGAAQVLFFEGDDCDVPYDGNRKYQGQTGITLPKL